MDPKVRADLLAAVAAAFQVAIFDPGFEYRPPNADLYGLGPNMYITVEREDVGFHGRA